MRARPAPLAEVIRGWEDAIRLLQFDNTIGLDLETSGLSPWKDCIAVVSLYGEQSGQTAVLHIRGKMPEELRIFLCKPHVLWVGHNVAQFDMQFLAMAGINIYGTTYFDTLIGEQMTLSSGRRDVRVNLQASVQRRLGVHLKKGMGESSWMAEELTQEQLTYCVEDVFYLPKIMDKQLAHVADTPQARAMDFEQRLIPIVARITLNGLPLNQPALDSWKSDLVVTNLEARRTINDVLSPALNVNSPLQVKKAFLEKFDLDLEKADVETLSALSEYEGPVGNVAAAILISRRAIKRTGFYDDDWVQKYVWNGYVHARFWQVGTDTFRFSSSDPNLQQIPRDGRRIFGGLLGHKVVSCDFSQLEVRVAAGIANDQDMLAALESEDIHRTVASALFDIPAEEITSQQRRVAKAATFTLLFGGSASGLVRYAKLYGAKLTDLEAKTIVYKFFDRYKAINAERNNAKWIGSQGRPVTITLANGAKRVLAARATSFRGEAPKMLVPPSQILNTRVQGSAALVLKYGLFEIHKRGLLPYLGAVVHDECVSIVPDKEVADYEHELGAAMRAGMMPVLGDVPIETESKIGDFWS